MFSNKLSDQQSKPAPGTEPVKRDVLGLPSPLQPKLLEVMRARRPLRRNYVALALLLIAVLTGIVLLTLWQWSPVLTSYVIGWFLSSEQTGYSYRQLANDSPLQPPGDPDRVGFERHLFALINKARQDRGLPLLRNNDNLSRSARAHALEMAQLKRFGLASVDGKSPLDRAQSAGYLSPQVILELIGAGLQRPDQVIAALNSHPNSVQGLFDPDVAEVGVGYAFSEDDPNYHHYWVIDLGCRSVATYTVVVNDGAGSTASPQVTLRIGGKGWARQMQVSNSPDFPDAKWEIYAETKTWTLSEGTGSKKVYVKLRGLGGEEVTIIGEITLNEP